MNSCPEPFGGSHQEHAGAPRFRVRLEGRQASWWRGYCGCCAACATGFEAWCSRWTEPTDDGALWSDPVEVGATDHRGLVDAALCLDLLDGTGLAEPILLLVGREGRTARAAALLQSRGPGATLCVSGEGRWPDALRSRVAGLTGSGRPDVVIVLDGPASAACRGVRRGGYVALLGREHGEVDLDTVTMRELTLLPVRRPHRFLTQLAALEA